jgi:hypothetical protein
VSAAAGVERGASFDGRPVQGRRLAGAPAALARRVSGRSSAPSPAAADERANPGLRLVPDVRAGAPRAPFITLMVVLLAGGLLGLLGLNTVLAQDAFRLHALTVEGRALADREQVLEREVETLRTPRNLAARARELGMVPTGSPAFLRLEDGAVLGAEVPAEAPGAEPGAVAPAPAAGGAAQADQPAAPDDAAGAAAGAEEAPDQ